VTQATDQPTIEAAQRPQRSIPLPILVRVLFGGMVSQMGWLFLGFGLIFVWVFVVHVDFSGLLRSVTRQVETRGQVIDVEETNLSEGGDDDAPGTPIYRIAYAFAGPGGRRFEGAS